MFNNTDFQIEVNDAAYSVEFFEDAEEDCIKVSVVVTDMNSREAFHPRISPYHCSKFTVAAWLVLGMPVRNRFNWFTEELFDLLSTAVRDQKIALVDYAMLIGLPGSPANKDRTIRITQDS